MSEREVVILDGTRTAIGKFGGTLKSFSAAQLGAHCIKELVARNNINSPDIDNVIMGMVVQAGAGQLPTRQASIKAGLSVEVPGMLINKVCASGMRAVTLASTLIRANENELILAGGMESMSNVPHLDFNSRWGMAMGDITLKDGMVHDGLWCAFDNVHMAAHGQKIAEEYHLERSDMDRFAARSQQLWSEATERGFYKEQITPFVIPQRKGDPIVFEVDEFPRAGTTLESLAKLPPVLGTQCITAGNAPGVNDGACVMVVTTAERAAKMGKKPLAKIIDHAYVAKKPYEFSIAPALATKKLLDKRGLSVDQIKRFECNEAFAAVCLVCGQILKWDESRVNVNGGAIAVGHPIGASGARIILTLAHELQRIGGGLGVAMICSGTGQGDAILIEV